VRLTTTVCLPELQERRFAHHNCAAFDRLRAMPIVVLSRRVGDLMWVGR
jgi:hypothetical protein